LYLHKTFERESYQEMVHSRQGRKARPGLIHPQKVLRGAQQLVIYRGILADPIMRALLELLDSVGSKRGRGCKRLNRIAESYARFFSRLAAKAEAGCEGRVGTPLQNHLLDLILGDENTFSTKAQSCGLVEFGKSLLWQVGLDLRRLHAFYLLDSEQLLAAMQAADSSGLWLNWDQLGASTPMVRGPSSSGNIKGQFHESADWELLLPALANHYLQVGCGMFGQYRAFHWKRSSSGGLIEPIQRPDPIRLDELVGCEDQKDWLVRNTSHFLAGYPANNVFVYGDRGTGKSSAIKALLHQFSTSPLRMIEISRDDLGDLPEVMKQVAPRRERFLLFVDDLSFEEGETQYKTLKAVLEGSLEARPKNVLIYASSNRRHLIKEFFSDRNESQSDEVRRQDTLQEKVSLADRFGIQLAFVAPDQNEYLAIVRSMVQQRNLSLPEEELKRQALQWVQLHNARSGRTARQFVDYLAAELGGNNQP
jgi:predicted AAA+ superfamily ATPase